jgi:hypothetical protein
MDIIFQPPYIQIKQCISLHIRYKTMFQQCKFHLGLCSASEVYSTASHPHIFHSVGAHTWSYFGGRNVQSEMYENFSIKIGEYLDRLQ